MNLSRAIAIAAEAHDGQTDKAGEPYILHPLRVMLATETDEQRIAAVLHDVIEDTDWTFERLVLEGFGPDIINAVDALTRRTHEAYPEFIERAGADPIARAVKIADIRDNLSDARADSCPGHLRRRYEDALARLGAADHVQAR